MYTPFLIIKDHAYIINKINNSFNSTSLADAVDFCSYVTSVFQDDNCQCEYHRSGFSALFFESEEDKLMFVLKYS